MIRTQIYLTVEEIDALKALSNRTGFSVDFLRGFPAAVKYIKSYSEEIIIQCSRG